MDPRALVFFLSRPQSEELTAEHVIREHHRGSALGEILDGCIPRRLQHGADPRLLDLPEMVHAVGEDMIAAHRPAL